MESFILMNFIVTPIHCVMNKDAFHFSKSQNISSLNVTCSKSLTDVLVKTLPAQ